MGRHSSCHLWSPSCVPGTCTRTWWQSTPSTAWEVGVAHADFTSHKVGAQCGQAVFPQPLLSGRAAASDDKVCAPDTGTVLPLHVPETEHLVW